MVEHLVNISVRHTTSVPIFLVMVTNQALVVEHLAKIAEPAVTSDGELAPKTALPVITLHGVRSNIS